MFRFYTSLRINPPILLNFNPQKNTPTEWEATSGKVFVEFYQQSEGKFTLLPQMKEVRRIASYHFNEQVVGKRRAQLLRGFLYASMTHPCERDLTHDPELIQTQFKDEFNPNSKTNLGKFISPDSGKASFLLLLFFLIGYLLKLCWISELLTEKEPWRWLHMQL